ncbi:CDP-alcohol phosphatidyltransferase family protein [Dactylosporangium sp. NPDC005572]|uniref:CDP-alcohol phosphatidyltransferase family protein n=1 Tax=Dactylosporangium sp. NPDC005572 TaxID=3156889 RepID=UPI0033A553A8
MPASSWDDYAERWSASHGGYDPRTASPVVRGWLRLSYRIGAAMVRVGVRDPNAATAAGLLLAAAVPVVALGGRWWAVGGAVLVLLSAVADSVDGVLAVVTGRASRLGQVWDSVADRLSEAAWMAAFWLLGAPVWLAVGCTGVMWLHEYIRARATVAGMSDIGTVTVAERPTRVLIAIFGLLATAAAGPAAAAAALAVMLAVTAAGLIQLLRTVRKQLSAPGR